MTELTKADLDEGARLMETDPFDCCTCPCAACVWLEENAKALIAGCRYNEKLHSHFVVKAELNVVQELRSLRAENEKLRVEAGKKSVMDILAEGQGEDDA